MSLCKHTFAVAAVAMLIGASPGAQSINLAVPNRSNAYPSIAAQGRFLAVVWGASTSDGAPDVYVAVSMDGGRTFRSPTMVNDATSQASLSGEQPPRVSLIPRAQGAPSIVVTWTSKADGQTHLLSARSDDGGTSFARPKTWPGSEAPGNRGWQATAIERNGHAVAVWLDHRELAGAGGTGDSGAHSGHAHGASAAQQRDGVARAQLSKLFFARLGNAESVRQLTGGVCYCCKTAIATGENGAIYAAWRHVYPGNIRDIAFTISTDGGRTFAPQVRVSEDRWVLDGCPENGPAIAVDKRGRIHIVWPTLLPAPTSDGEPTMALFYASSEDGRQFSRRYRIPTQGFPGHAQIDVNAGGEVVLAWDELIEGRRRVAFSRGTFDRDGTPHFTSLALHTDAPGNYPALAATADGTVIAWTSGAGQSVVRVESVPR